MPLEALPFVPYHQGHPENADINMEASTYNEYVVEATLRSF
jgi:hypothetical protein